jgi:hypothetical protein
MQASTAGPLCLKRALSLVSSSASDSGLSPRLRNARHEGGMLQSRSETTTRGCGKVTRSAHLARFSVKKAEGVRRTGRRGKKLGLAKLRRKEQFEWTSRGARRRTKFSRFKLVHKRAQVFAASGFDGVARGRTCHL